jgi:hypothetical protein
MTGGMRYGDVALGVEAALPALMRPARQARRERRYLAWLLAALRRWA